jgi:hypothetical protein
MCLADLECAMVVPEDRILVLVSFMRDVPDPRRQTAINGNFQFGVAGLIQPNSWRVC